jgi:uncharacterized membrane protein
LSDAVVHSHAGKKHVKNEDAIHDRSTVALQQRSLLRGAESTLARWVGSGRGDRVARAAGWLGIGLGAAQLLAPRAVGRWLGGSRPDLVRITGAIELAAGLGLLRWRASVRRVEVQRSITVDASPEVLYGAWRDPLVMGEILRPMGQVTGQGGGRLHWQVEGPLGRTLTWYTEIVEDRPYELLRWSTGDDGPVSHRGSVRFSQDRLELGTVVTLRLELDGRIPGIVPGALADKALRRFKSLIETGEIPTLEHNPGARQD